MESLDYYVSIQVNPYAEDEGIRDQEDVILAAEFQFKMDSIVEKIGTNECKHNVDLFFDELIQEMEFSTLANFYNRCFTQLIEVYELNVLLQYTTNRHFEQHMEIELRKLLDFFEREGWIECFSHCLPYDPEVYIRGDLVEFLNLHYKQIMDQFKNKKEQLSKYVYHQLVMGARPDTVLLMNKLIMKNRNGLAAQMILNRGVK